MAPPAIQPSGAPTPGPGSRRPEPHPDAWRVLPPTEPGGDPVPHERFTQGFLQRIEAARSLGDRASEEELRADYERFLAATGAAWELAEAIPVGTLLAGRLPPPGRERRAELGALLARLEGYRATAPRDYLSQACALMHLGDAQGAMLRIDAGLSLDPEHLLLRCARGEVQRGMGNLTQAHAEFSMAARIAPDDDLALAGLGRVLIAMGHGAAAVVPLRRALQTTEHDPELWRLAAEAMIGAGRLEQSLAFLRRAQSLDMGSLPGAQRLGQVLTHLGRHAEAATVYERHLGFRLASEGQPPTAPLPATVQRVTAEPRRGRRDTRWRRDTRLRRVLPRLLRRSGRASLALAGAAGATAGALLARFLEE